MSKTSLFNSRLKTDWIFLLWLFLLLLVLLRDHRYGDTCSCLNTHRLSRRLSSLVCVCVRLSFINEKTTPSSESWRARGEYKLMYWKGNRLTHTQCIENNVEVAASLYFVLQVYRRREGHTWETELHRSLLKHGRNRC